MRLWVLGLVAVLAAAIAARGDDPNEPTYADKPASWWIGEYLGGSDKAAAAAVLRKMGETAAPQVAARLASTEASDDRIKLLELLAHRGKVPASAIPVLRSSLKSGTAREQSAALGVVQCAGPMAAELANEVAALLESPKDWVRGSAAAALGALGDAASPHVALLVARIAKENEDGARSCVKALGDLGPRAAGALPAVLAFAAGRPPQFDVVRALVSIGPDDPTVAGEIVRAVESGDSRTRSSVGTFLCEREPAGDAIAIASDRLAASEDREVRVIAAAALGRGARRGGTVPDALFRLLADADIGVCGNAARSLEAYAAKDHGIAPRVADVWRVTGTPNALMQLMNALLPESGPALLEAALGDHVDRRQAAWHILVRAGERRVAADAGQLTRMVLDTRVPIELRREFLRRVLSLQLVEEEVSRDVCAAVVTKADESLALEAIHPLASDAARRAALIAAAQRTEPAVRATAVGAMHSLMEKNDDVRAACAAALDDDDASVRSAALRALQGFDRGFWSVSPAVRSAVEPKLVGLARTGVRERAAVHGIVSAFPDAERTPDPLLALLPFDDSSEQAIHLLARTPRCTAEVLAPLVDGADPVLAARAVRVLLARKADASLAGRLKGWIGSGDPRLAREAVLAACVLPPEAIVELGGGLIRAARGGVEGVAWPACAALARIADREPAARDAILAVADDPKNSAQLAVTADLPKLGEAGIVRLVALLDHEQRDARRNACLVIMNQAQQRRPGYAVAIPALERIAKGDDLELARFADEALKSLRK
jgi:hypothetical protein